MTKESDKLEGLALGANDYIYKPFNIEEVKLKVERLLRVSKERCEYYRLTDREIEVVLALKEVKSDDEGAGRLYISTGTFKNHKKRIYKKVKVSNKKELFKKLF